MTAPDTTIRVLSHEAYVALDLQLAALIKASKLSPDLLHDVARLALSGGALFTIGGAVTLDGTLALRVEPSPSLARIIAEARAYGGEYQIGRVA